MDLIYKNRNTLLQKLYPLTTILLMLLYIIAFMKISNVIYLLIILLSLLCLAKADGCLKECLNYGKLMLPFSILMIIINPLVVRSGDTVLYTGTLKFPIVGPLRITQEAILYGILTGFRIFAVTLTFGFGNLIIHPDRAFGFLSKYLKKSSLLMSMTVRLFPTILKSYREITEIEKLRGNNYSNKNVKKVVTNKGNIVNILFLSSLEDSTDMAESMYSRGYGIGKRSSYFHEKITKWDFILILFNILVYTYMSFLSKKGLLTMEFYPKVDNPIKLLNYKVYILCVLFFIPSILNWWWKLWK